MHFPFTSHPVRFNSTTHRPHVPHCRAHSPIRPLFLLLAHHLSSRYTAFLLLLRTAAARSVYSYLQGKQTGKQVNGQTSKPVNERSTRSNQLTRLLVYKPTCLRGNKRNRRTSAREVRRLFGRVEKRGQASAAPPEGADQNELRLQPWAQRLRRCGRVRHA